MSSTPSPSAAANLRRQLRWIFAAVLTATILFAVVLVSSLAGWDRVANVANGLLVALTVTGCVTLTIAEMRKLRR